VINVKIAKQKMLKNLGFLNLKNLYKRTGKENNTHPIKPPKR